MGVGGGRGASQGTEGGGGLNVATRRIERGVRTAAFVSRGGRLRSSSFVSWTGSASGHRWWLAVVTWLGGRQPLPPPHGHQRSNAPDGGAVTEHSEGKVARSAALTDPAPAPPSSASRGRRSGSASVTRRALRRRLLCARTLDRRVENDAAKRSICATSRSRKVRHLGSDPGRLGLLLVVDERKPEVVVTALERAEIRALAKDGTQPGLRASTAAILRRIIDISVLLDAKLDGTTCRPSSGKASHK